MPTPTLPRKWTDPKNVPAQAQAKKDVAALETLAKLSKNAEAIQAVTALKQKFGNWLTFDVTPTKKEAKDKIAPTVVTLYNHAQEAVSKAPLPTGKYEVALKTYTTPKFMHNATQAGTLPTWTFEYWDEGVPVTKKQIKITMTRNMYGDENKQAEQMSDAAVAQVKHLTGATEVKVVKS